MKYKVGDKVKVRSDLRVGERVPNLIIDDTQEQLRFA